MDNVRQIWRADVEAFKDHWGGFDDSDEHLKSWIESPSFDPTMWVIAWDGDEVAGGVVNGIHPEENAALGVQRGWLHSVFTRRPWRKRGLANALIARSLVLIKERGMDFGVLGVDADNPTGALGPVRAQRLQGAGALNSVAQAALAARVFLERQKPVSRDLLEPRPLIRKRGLASVAGQNAQVGWHRRQSG